MIGRRRRSACSSVWPLCSGQARAAVAARRLSRQPCGDNGGRERDALRRLAVGVYRNYPLSMDEYSAVFQSKVFASGPSRRTAAALARSLADRARLQRTFPADLGADGPGESRLTGQDSRSCSRRFIARCSLAVQRDARGRALFLIHRITLEVTGDRRAAGWAVLFALASSAFWGSAISYYSMQAHLTANLLYAWLLLKPTAARSFAAGLVGALALLLHNPVPHMLFAAPWLIAFALDDRTRRWLIPLVLGYPPALAVGLGWAWLRSDIAPAAQGAGDGRALKERLHAARCDMLNMSVAAAAKMWVWAVPCLFYFAFLGYLRARDNRHVRLLLLSAVSTFAGIFLSISIRDTGGATGTSIPPGESFPCSLPAA